jgi:hypothetical protein
MAEKTRQLDEEELKIAFDGPAVLANRCLLTLGPDGVRIAFTVSHPVSWTQVCHAAGLSDIAAFH